jgi:hypothetical protein
VVKFELPVVLLVSSKTYEKKRVLYQDEDGLAIRILFLNFIKIYEGLLGEVCIQEILYF